MREPMKASQKVQVFLLWNRAKLVEAKLSQTTETVTRSCMEMIE